MAGSLTASNRRRNAEDSSEIYRWTIGFARFVHYPSSPSPHPVLKPLGKREQYHSPHGTWLSASSSTVSLHIVDELNRSDVILSVKLGQKVLVSWIFTLSLSLFIIYSSIDRMFRLVFRDGLSLIKF